MTVKSPTPISKSAPVSVRLTPEERDALRIAAGTASLSEYIRARLFGLDHTDAVETRLSPQARQRLLARILVALGKSEVSASLSELVQLAHLGALPEDADVTASINATHAELQALRTDLLRALGLRPPRDGGTP